MTPYNLDFSKARILVVGDIMLDRYWHGHASRISPEAPVPVMKVNRIEERPGGAGNVALNVAALGAETILLGITGDDEASYLLEEYFHKTKINCKLQRIENFPTITKLRAVSHHQQLIRLDFEESLDHQYTESLLTEYKRFLPNVDAVILSDYGKGTLHHSSLFISLAKEHNVPVFIDPKSLDFSVYQGATVITPNLKEFEAVVGPCHDEDEMTARAQKLLKTHDFAALLVTRGEQGMSLFRQHETPVHIPVHAQEVFDVTGAGDTVIATLATAVAMGINLEEAIFLANAAASVSVSKLGASTVTIPELRRAVHNLHEGGILEEDDLLLAVQDAKAHGEKIVMTNGCFDILHAGHVHYLNEAKKLGDRLIIAVNDDDSVRRLKGPTRPVNTIAKRMAVLAGLSAVDWVVPFSEDTPERLICKVLPDVLVKGGDWKPEQIAGGQCVLDNGGDVKIIEFLEGHSTTSTIDRIKDA